MYQFLTHTVHVDEEGAVAYGRPSLHMAANIRDASGPRAVAVARRTIHGRRFAPNVTPSGVDMNVTAPHNCENHIREFESSRDRTARMLLGMPEEAVA